MTCPPTEKKNKPDQDRPQLSGKTSGKTLRNGAERIAEARDDDVRAERWLLMVVETPMRNGSNGSGTSSCRIVHLRK